MIESNSLILAHYSTYLLGPSANKYKSAGLGRLFPPAGGSRNPEAPETGRIWGEEAGRSSPRTKPPLKSLWSIYHIGIIVGDCTWHHLIASFGPSKWEGATCEGKAFTSKLHFPATRSSAPPKAHRVGSDQPGQKQVPTQDVVLRALL